MSVINDNGWSSRKFWYAIGISIAIFVAGIMAAFWEGFRPVLTEVLGALIGVYATFCGANVTAKWAIGKVSSGLESEYEEDGVEHVNKFKVKPPIEPDHSEED